MLLLCTGLGSSFYHSTMWHAGQIFDTFPMDMFILFIGVALSINVVSRAKVIQDRKDLKNYSNVNGIKNLIIFLGLVFLVYQVMLIGLPIENKNGHHRYSPMSSFQTIFPLSIVLFASICAFRISDENKVIVIAASVSFGIAIAFHYIDESCPNPWIYPHAFWHFFSAYAALCLLVLHVRLQTEGHITWSYLLPRVSSAYSRI
jgi:hypothetical protein